MNGFQRCSTPALLGIPVLMAENLAEGRMNGKFSVGGEQTMQDHLDSMLIGSSEINYLKPVRNLLLTQAPDAHRC
jgi:hypothetical protein